MKIFINQIDTILSNQGGIYNFRANSALSIMNTKIIDQFIDHLWLEDGLSKNTLNSYRFDLELFTEWLAVKLKKKYIRCISSRYSAISFI